TFLLLPTSLSRALPLPSFLSPLRRPPTSTLFPYTTLFRSIKHFPAVYRRQQEFRPRADAVTRILRIQHSARAQHDTVAEFFFDRPHSRFCIRGIQGHFYYSEASVHQCTGNLQCILRIITTQNADHPVVLDPLQNIHHHLSYLLTFSSSKLSMAARSPSPDGKPW